jgi:DNA-binding LacI/PurR family transcriptional regulator
VPQEVAVIGTDDIVESSYSRPTLTTVAQDVSEIASLSVDVLLARIGAGPTSHRARWPPASPSRCGRAPSAPAGVLTSRGRAPDPLAH